MPAAQGGQLRVRKVPGAGPAAPVAIGETVILMTPLFIRIETPAKGRGGCSRMTASPTARLLASLAKLQKNGSKRHARSAARPLRWLAFVSVDLCRAHGGSWVFSVTLVIFTNGPKACARTPQSDSTVGGWPFLFLHGLAISRSPCATPRSTRLLGVTVQCCSNPEPAAACL